MPAAPFWEQAPEVWDTLTLGSNTLPGATRVSGRISRKIDIRSPAGGDGARLRDRGYEPAAIEAENRCWTDEQLAAIHDVLAAIHPRSVTRPTVSNRAALQLDRARYELDYIQTAVANNMASRLDRNATARANELERDIATLEARASVEERANSARAARPPRSPFDCTHPSLSMLGIRSVLVIGVSIPELTNGVLTTRISMLEWTPEPAPAPGPATRSQGSERGNAPTAFDNHRSARRPTATPPARTTT